LENLENTGLIATAHTTDDNTIAALQHETFPSTGIQFHPESVGTDAGQQLLNNWAKLF
jgi:anthranilate/para-aminobenzoate synthase component II